MNESQSLFEATVRVRVRANTKMEAAQKLRMLVISSAVVVRDLEINEFNVVDE